MRLKLGVTADVKYDGPISDLVDEDIQNIAHDAVKDEIKSQLGSAVDYDDISIETASSVTDTEGE